MELAASKHVVIPADKWRGIPDSLEDNLDYEIDSWAQMCALEIAGRRGWPKKSSRCSRVLTSVIRDPTRLDRAIAFLRQLHQDLFEIEGRSDRSDAIATCRESNAIQRRLQHVHMNLLNRVQRVISKPHSARRLGRPSTNSTLAKWMARVLMTTDWSARKASRYTAKRVSRIWTEEEAPHPAGFFSLGEPVYNFLTESEVRQLWGGWWATDPKERHTRDRLLAERIRLAYTTAMLKKGRKLEDLLHM